jgi:hypothetical protein
VSRTIFDGGLRYANRLSTPLSGAKETLPADPGKDDRPLGPNAEVHHNDVNRARGKPIGHVVQHHGRVADILRRNAVRHVNEDGRRVQRKNHSLHRHDVGTAGAEIGGEGDHGHGVAMKDDGP